MFYGNEYTIIKVELINGRIEVIKKYPRNMMLASDPPQRAPDLVEKEIFGVVDGEIKFIKKIEGTHTPVRLLEETITFEEEA